MSPPKLHVFALAVALVGAAAPARGDEPAAPRPALADAPAADTPAAERPARAAAVTADASDATARPALSAAADDPYTAEPPAGADDPDAALLATADRHSLVQSAIFARYERLPGDVDGGRAGLSARALLGRRAGYCLGADLELGGSSEGLVYGATLALTGLGVRLGDGGLIALCGGVGIGGARGVVPAALELPVELRARAQLGPVRIFGHVTGRFTALAEARDGGSRVDGVDEIDATLAVGWGRQHAYWQGTVAGSGPYLGVSYRELMGERLVAIALGIELLGGK